MTLAMKMSSRVNPMASMIFVMSWPERPTNGSPCLSSSAPGASPMNISSAERFPTPKTTCVREATRFGHFTQPRIAFSSSSQVHSVAGGGGRGWTAAAGRVVAALRRRFNAVCEALGADLMPFWTSCKRGSASASAC